MGYAPSQQRPILPPIIPPPSLPAPLSFSAFEREWCRFYRQHNEAPNALQVSPELEVTAMQICHSECTGENCVNPYYQRFAIVIEDDFDASDWRLAHLARGDIIAGDLSDWAGTDGWMFHKSMERCAYCGRPAHRCGCGGAE